MFWNIFWMILSGWFLLGFIEVGLILGYSHHIGNNMDATGRLIVYTCCFVFGPLFLEKSLGYNPRFKYGLRFW